MARQAEQKKSEQREKSQITMKKGNSVINIDNARKEHYEKFGYIEVAKADNKSEQPTTED